MTVLLPILGFLAVVSLALGFYFRIAEYDILESDRVWDRIAPASLAIVEDESVPDELAMIVTAFSMLAGCGCFVNAILFETAKRKLGVSKASTSNSLDAKVSELSDESRHALFNLLRDLVLFDSLHAPILGRLCRAIHHRQLRRIEYYNGEPNRLVYVGERYYEKGSEPKPRVVSSDW